MPDAYEHLRIEKEDLVNLRRKIKRSIPPKGRSNETEHAQHIQQTLNAALEEARTKPGSDDGNFILKLNYSGSLDFKNLSKHGIEFLSQEDNTICIVFTSEKGLAEFSDHLSKLGVSAEDDLTYKQILLALEGVDNWNREDKESWAIKNIGIPQGDEVVLDVELWPFGLHDSDTRKTSIPHFEKWLKDNSIQIIDSINRDSLLLYRLRVNVSKLDNLFEHRDVRYVDLPPRTGITYQQINLDISKIPENLPSPPDSASRVCILDSGLNTNHPLLRTAMGEAASFLKDLGPDDDVGHGTAVAGIALYGNLEECTASNQWTPELWLLSGKIMRPDPNDPSHCIYDEKTIESSIEESVQYFIEQGCKIFNLSLGNDQCPYDGSRIGGIAYTLDLLARKYNILFVVSAGNFCGTETVPQTDWYDEYPDYLFSPESVIIDPAPCLNGLTVGAIANHTASHQEQRYGNQEINELTPASENQPSPFTRHRPSSKSALKPELVAYGGNDAVPLRREGEQKRIHRQFLGVLTTHHQPIGNTLLKEISGTSFSAPYISHLAGRILNYYPNASVNLIRALLVNHADVPLACNEILPPGTENNIRDIVGYGKVNTDTLFRSIEDEVVLLAEDSITNDSHQFYELPLPKDFLRSKRAKRELRVSLAYCPPVRTTRLDYTATKISFRLVKGHNLNDVERHFNNTKKDQYKTKSDISPSNRIIGSQEREKGTVQSSIWNFRKLNARFKYYVVVTRQDREWGSEMCDELENYAIVVTVADKENSEAQLYAQIRVRLQEKARLRAQERIST